MLVSHHLLSYITHGCNGTLMIVYTVADPFLRHTSAGFTVNINKSMFLISMMHKDIKVHWICRPKKIMK